MSLCVDNSLVAPMTAVVITKNAATHQLGKIFLGAICSINNTDYLWVFHVFS